MEKEFKQLALVEKNLLAEMRLAIQGGERQRAVCLGAQRYQVLKQMQGWRTNHSSLHCPAFSQPGLAEVGQRLSQRPIVPKGNSSAPLSVCALKERRN